MSEDKQLHRLEGQDRPQLLQGPQAADHRAARSPATSRSHKQIDQHHGRLRRRGAEARSTRNLRFLQGGRQAHRLPHQADAGGADPRCRPNELIGVIQIINNKAGMPFGALAEEGVARAVADARHRLQAAPEAAGRVKTKYDDLVADAVLSADELELASRQARKKAIDIEQVLIDEFQVKIPAIGAALSQVLRRALRAVQGRPHQAGGPAEEPEARVRRDQPVGAARRRQGRPGRAVPRPRADPLLAHRLQRVPARPASSTRSRRRRTSRRRSNQFYGAEPPAGGDLGDIDDLLGAHGRRPERSARGRGEPTRSRPPPTTSW